VSDVDVNPILEAAGQGDRQAAQQLLPLVYDELCKLAASRLARERPGHSLDVTALVHEAYLRLVHGPQDQCWTNRDHFFAAAAEAMRRILVDRARRNAQLKRGGDLHRIPLDAIEPVAIRRREDYLALEESLACLEAHDPLAAKVVKLRYFAGLTMAETAEKLAIPLRTAERNWAYARTWLLQHLQRETN
jgi:RNA polymerase sigma factor (TIGR02999 family)